MAEGEGFLLGQLTGDIRGLRDGLQDFREETRRGITALEGQVTDLDGKVGGLSATLAAHCSQATATSNGTRGVTFTTRQMFAIGALLGALILTLLGVGVDWKGVLGIGSAVVGQ